MIPVAHSARLMERLHRNKAALIMAGGRLPDRGWAEPVTYSPGEPRPPGSLRWRIVHEQGWSNVVSPWPVRLIMGATDLHFRATPEGDCIVGLTE